jgi:hypothetical protein
VGSLEDAEDYKAFEATIIADYCPETAVARELVLRLASLLWRLRRATSIETDLFSMHAERAEPNQSQNLDDLVYPARRINQIGLAATSDNLRARNEESRIHQDQIEELRRVDEFARARRPLTDSFLCLAKLESGAFERLNRYEVRLWRQVVQILFVLRPIKFR